MDRELLVNILSVLFLIILYLVISTWWNRRSYKGRKDRYERGYSYAATALLNGTETPKKLLEKAENRDSNEFEQGIKQAVRDYINQFDWEDNGPN